MKSFRNLILSWFVLVALLPVAAQLPLGVSESDGLLPKSTDTNPIPFSELGAKATADYKGDAIGITATPDGATLRTGFQKLAGTVTRDGLRLSSTEAEGGSLQLTACAVGRVHGAAQALSATGCVASTDTLVSFTRPGLTEEYSVSADGVRQDFVVAEAPAGSGELAVELEVAGATAQVAAHGATLTLAATGRALAYHRLHVTDAQGRELAARLEVFATDRLRVVVQDASAVYPVRIDPTFSDADWVSLNPSIPGASNSVAAVAVDGSGNLYVGGDFTFIGTVAANRIAKWNGSAWSALGSGMDNDVRALAVNGSDLYAGGRFDTAGGTTVNRIAKWNGITWSGLGSGVDEVVFSITPSGSDLYVGGAFTAAGGTVANRIAKWNGSAWSSLGSGLNNSVYALAVSGSDVYAGGIFDSAGGTAANSIAKWNGSAWSALGTGMYGGVRALAVSGSDLYAGGGFTTASGSPANRIAKWNGSVWSALGSGMDDAVLALAVSGSDLYAGGQFTTAGGSPANHIAKWDGTQWSALGSGINSTVAGLAVVGNNLYAGGYFDVAGGTTSHFITKWNGSAWSPLGAGLNNSVYALAVSGSDLFIGGIFTTAGGIAASHIAKWDGSAWSALGTGMDGQVYALAVSGSDLYAGGHFTTAGGIQANYLAKWNGSAWLALGTGMNATGTVSALAVSGSDLYAGGHFTTAGGIAVNRIAKWNGSVWSALGTGMDDTVTALAVIGSDLYAGGAFTTAGGTVASSIAKWDGSTWSPLGSGVDGGVTALAVSGSDLYAGGGFTTAGGSPANNIAKWNGSVWSALGTGLEHGIVIALAVSGSNLYAGGDFTTAGGTSANCIAKWNGSAWSALGSGMNKTVWTLAAAGTSRLFVGGDFNLAGTTISHYITQANIAPAPAVTGISPSSGSTAGGTSVTITGTGFAGATSVTMGGIPATNVAVVNSTTITCTTPAQATGTASVLVTTPLGSNVANTLFTYVLPDPSPPVLAISTPLGGATVNEPTTTMLISGTLNGSTGDPTIDPAGVSISVNGGAPISAVVSGNKKTWSVTLNTAAANAAFTPGSNSIVATGRDLAGNIDVSPTRSFTYKVMRPLALTVLPLSTSGSLTITPALVAGNARVGFPYTVRAVAKAGYFFGNWSGKPTGTSSTTTFTFAAGDTATANFTDSPFTTAVAGLYNGIVRGSTAATDTQNNAGLFTASVTLHTGAFTGSLVIDGVRAPVAGVFNHLTKKFTTLPVTNGFVYDLTLHDLATPRTITGTITKYRRTSPVAVLNVNATQGNTSFTGGPFLVAFSAPASPAPDLSDDEYPHGNGYASMTIGTKGVATVRGLLADGTAFASASTVCAGANIVPVFALFASRTGSLVGDATITAPAVTGTGFRWFRSANASHYYPHGYANGGTTGLTIDIAAGHSTAGTNLPATVSFSGGEFAAAVTGINVVTGTSTAASAKMSVTAGIIKGEWAGNGSYPGKHLIGGVNVNGVNYGYILSPLPLHTDGTGQGGLVSPAP